MQNGVVCGGYESLKIIGMSPFDTTHATAYSTLIETMLYCFHLHLASPYGVTLVEFSSDLWQPKTRLPGLSYGVVSVNLYV